MRQLEKYYHWIFDDNKEYHHFMFNGIKFTLET